MFLYRRFANETPKDAISNQSKKYHGRHFGIVFTIVVVVVFFPQHKKAPKFVSLGKEKKPTIHIAATKYQWMNG